MPTGYTADVQSGEITEFRDFAIRCARAFGALITLRDEPMDAPIPDELKSNDYNAKRVTEAEQRLADVRSWDDEKAKQEADTAHSVALTDYHDSRAKTAEQNARYYAMLAKVEQWQPPTIDHENMKKFMIDQLEESIKFDSYTPAIPVRMSGAEYKASEIAHATRDIEYHTKAQREENERTAGRNAWIKALRESLAIEEAS